MQHSFYRGLELDRLQELESDSHHNLWQPHGAKNNSLIKKENKERMQMTEMNKRILYAAFYSVWLRYSILQIRTNYQHHTEKVQLLKIAQSNKLVWLLISLIKKTLK